MIWAASRQVPFTNLKAHALWLKDGIALLSAAGG